MNGTQISLNRSLTTFQVVMYGLGTIIGAGIFVLLGKVVGVAGQLAPFSFLLAAGLAGITALSFAELSSRYPKCAGEAVYTYRAFNSKYLATFIGFLVILSGIVSCAVLVNGFVGYFHEFFQINRELSLVLVVAVLALLSLTTIDKSVSIAVTITLLEVFAILFLIFSGAHHISSYPTADFFEFFSSIEQFELDFIGVVTGAVLAFYAFIGFEDMVNMAEETKEPSKTLPKAIIATLILSSSLYYLLALIAVQAAPNAELAATDAPLAYLYENLVGPKSEWISLIAIFSLINGALIQIIMGSRILYGLSQQGWILGSMKKLSLKAHIPYFAVITMCLCVLAFAILLPLIVLVRITAVIILAVFAIVNLSLIVIKKQKEEPGNTMRVPDYIPWLGFLLTSFFALFQLYRFFV